MKISKTNGLLIIVIAVAILGFAFYYMNNMNSSSQGTGVKNVSSDIPNAQVVSENKINAYKDGSYEKSGMYKSPAGDEEIVVTLKIKSGVVEEAKLIRKAENPKSIDFQKKFEEGFSQFVVGKSMNEIALDVVNGSSLTPKGFMDALDKIKAEAKV